jgi:hypothetical protein
MFRARSQNNGRRVLRVLSNFQTRLAHGHALQVEDEARRIGMRPLDGFESLFHEYHRTGVGFPYLLTPMITSKVQSLFKALTMMSYQQPLLRASITETAGLKKLKSVEGRTSSGFSILDRHINDAEAITEKTFSTTNFKLFSEDWPNFCEFYCDQSDAGLIEG